MQEAIAKSVNATRRSRMAVPFRAFFSRALDVALPTLCPACREPVGGNGLWDEAGVVAMTAGIDRVLHHLGMIPGPVPAAPQERPRMVTMWVPAAGADGLWYPAAEIGQTVTAGDVLGEIRDVFGVVRETVHSQQDGFILYRLSSLAVNKGEALLGVGTPLRDAEL